MIMERVVYVCLYVTSFQINPYLGCFKSEFDAVKSKIGLLIEYIKTSIMHLASVIIYNVMAYNMISRYLKS